MRTRSEIEMSSDYQSERAKTDLSTYPHARLAQLQLEVLLDIREQNERITSLLKSINDRDEDVLTGRRGRA